MLSNYYTLAVVASDLDARLKGKTIRAAYSQEKNELILAFEGLSDCLLISCSSEANTLYMHPHMVRARTNSADVLKTSIGKSIRNVSIQPMDRVISFAVDDGITMHAQFFGSKANVLLVDKEQQIVDAFKDARTVVGDTFKASHREFIHDIASLRALITQELTQTVSALLKRVSPVLGSTLVSEILFRTGLSAASRAEELQPAQVSQLEHSFTRVLTELSQPKPRVYLGTEPPYAAHRFSLVRLEHCSEFGEKTFADIHEAIRFFISRRKSIGSVESYATNITSTLQQHRTKLQRTIHAIEEDLASKNRGEEYERHATMLMANLGSVEKGAKSVTLPEKDGAVTVSIDPRLSPIRNAQRFFEKAKKSRLAYGQSRERLVELGAILRRADELLHTAEAIHTKEELKKFMTDRAEELEKFGIGKKAQEREQLPFRIFTVDGGFEVWAGKSSKNNDELTMKYAKPKDLWFHARGSSGSHVILKTNSGKGEPSRKAKVQAASIAAYYSKMKNATMVPVAMTEKKYVRKPRGAPPGTVVLEREKVIFAEPALPDSKRQ